LVKRSLAKAGADSVGTQSGTQIPSDGADLASATIRGSPFSRNEQRAGLASARFLRIERSTSYQVLSTQLPLAGPGEVQFLETNLFRIEPARYPEWRTQAQWPGPSSSGVERSLSFTKNDALRLNWFPGSDGIASVPRREELPELHRPELVARSRLGIGRRLARSSSAPDRARTVPKLSAASTTSSEQRQGATWGALSACGSRTD
jgi:hypothetical protein